ncbi:hypothetical protein [Kribbella sp. HUAS MG21]|uniref:Uncharacterized protein n=1 Tax=Kribbella sp. HUAS MG21 TaxID=3160966 RepID=A0AAU7T6D6_9ACTN
MSSHVIRDHGGVRESDVPPTDVQVVATLDVTTVDGHRVTFHLGEGLGELKYMVGRGGALHILAGEQVLQTFGPGYWATVTGEAVQVKGDEGYRPSRT